MHYPNTKLCPNFDIRPYIYNINKDSQIFTHLFHFTGHYHSETESKRLLRALEWFNNSYKQDPEVDDYEKYLSLAIAFETIFNSPQEGIQASMTSAITSLLGETPQLIDWVKDFYSQRSAIVHGRSKPSALYRGINSSDYHLSHLVMAKKIFSRCIKAILTSREAVYTHDIHEELISNDSRMKDLVKKLNTPNINKLFENKTFDLVDALSQRDPSGSTADAIKIADKLMPMTRSIQKKKKRKDLETLLDEILSFDKSKYADLAVKYSEFHSGFSPLYLGDKTISVKNISELALKGAIYNITSFMSWKLFREAFQSKGQANL